MLLSLLLPESFCFFSVADYSFDGILQLFLLKLIMRIGPTTLQVLTHQLGDCKINFILPINTLYVM